MYKKRKLSNSDFDKNGLDRTGTHWLQYAAFGFSAFAIFTTWAFFFDYNFHNFISTLKSTGIKTFIIHARKAISGLDTKRNRSIPKLDYKIVKDLKEEFPELEIILNGGIDNLKDCKNLLNNFDGIMLGRKIYDDPLFLLDVEKEIFNNVSQESLKSMMNKYLVYVLSLPNQKDINRALNHFMQLIKVISKNKKVRNEILNSLKNKDISIENIFIDLKEDLLRKDLALNL